MRRKQKKRILSAVFTFLCCCALGAAVYWVRAGIPSQSAQTPPGVHIGRRALLTVWVAGDPMGAANWLRRAAADFTKANPDARVWVRAASEADLERLAQTGEAAPDVFLFSLGTRISPAWLRPLAHAPALNEKRLAAGCLAGTRYALPVALSGYVLLARADAPNATKAPASLFGVTPAPDMNISPALTPAPRSAWPESLCADDRFGAAALALMGAPGGAKLAPAPQPQLLLEAGKAASVLSLAQAAACETGFTPLAAPEGTDLALFAAVSEKAHALAEAFVYSLLAEEAQRALSGCGLLAARKDCYLYGADAPAHAACERALANGYLPSAFLWPDEREGFYVSAQALYLAGAGVEELLR